MAVSVPITLTDTETEVFGVGVLEAYQHRDYFSEDWLLFAGMTAGEVINVPIMSQIWAQNKPDAEDHAGAATLTGTEVQLVDPIKAFTDVMKTQADIRPDLNLLTNVGRAIGRAVGFGRTLRIANHLIYHADSAANIITADFSPDTPAGTTTMQAVKDIMSAFDDAGIDEGNRYGLLKPTQFYSLRGLAEVISKDFTQGQAVNQSIGGNMAMVNYLNCDIRNMGGGFGIDWTTSDYDNLKLPSESGVTMEFNNNAVVGLFWHKEAAVVRHQTGLEASVDWIPREQVWLSLARLHMGVRALKTDGLYILVDSSAA